MASFGIVDTVLPKLFPCCGLRIPLQHLHCWLDDLGVVSQVVKQAASARLCPTNNDEVWERFGYAVPCQAGIDGFQIGVIAVYCWLV